MKKRSSSGSTIFLPSQSSDDLRSSASPILLQQQQEKHHSSLRPRKQARVTIMHVCPPVIVRVQPFDFRQTVQQLTGCNRSAHAPFLHTNCCDAPHHHHHQQQQRQHSQQKQEEGEDEVQDLVARGEAEAEAFQEKELLNHSNGAPPPPRTTTSSASTTTTSSSSSSAAFHQDQEEEDEIEYNLRYRPPSPHQEEGEDEDDSFLLPQSCSSSSIILPLQIHHQFSHASPSSSYDYSPDHHHQSNPLPFDQIPPFSDLLHDHVSPLDCYQPSLDHIRFDELPTPRSMHSFQDLDFSIMDTYGSALDQHQSELIVS